MVQRGEGAAPPPPVGGDGEDPPTALQLRIQGLNIKDAAEIPQRPLEAAPPQPPQELPELMISHRTDRSLILLSPHHNDPPCVLTLSSSVQGSIGLQRSGSLPRRRVGANNNLCPPPQPRPRSHHGHGILALQLPPGGLDPESYSACLQLAELQRRVREALAERERLLRAREARRAAKAQATPLPAQATPTSTQATPLPVQATPTVALATPTAEPEGSLDLLCALRSRGHRPECCGDVKVTADTCRGPLTKMGGRIKTWRRRWFLLDPTRKMLAYYGDKEQTKLKGVIYFQAIEEVYYDHGQMACKSPQPRLTFCLKTFGRLFCLVAPSGEALRIWMDALLAALGTGRDQGVIERDQRDLGGL